MLFLYETSKFLNINENLDISKLCNKIFLNLNQCYQITKSGGLMLWSSLLCGLVMSRSWDRVMLLAKLLEGALEPVHEWTLVSWIIPGLWWYYNDGVSVSISIDCSVYLIYSSLNTKVRVLHNKGGWVAATIALSFDSVWSRYFFFKKNFIAFLIFYTMGIFWKKLIMK